MDNARIEKILDKYNAEYAKMKRKDQFRMITNSYSISKYEADLLESMANRFDTNKSEFVRVCIHYFATSINYIKRDE